MNPFFFTSLLLLPIYMFTQELLTPNSYEEETGFTLVTDTSDLPFLNPDLSNRETAKLKLDNGIEVLLISDPGADKSAATVAVNAGSWNDPVEFPGMAHFCEHMLFMGTEKYPDENAFFSSLAEVGSG
jgi:insulysin